MPHHLEERFRLAVRKDLTRFIEEELGKKRDPRKDPFDVETVILRIWHGFEDLPKAHARRIVKEEAEKLGLHAIR